MHDAAYTGLLHGTQISIPKWFTVCCREMEIDADDADADADECLVKV